MIFSWVFDEASSTSTGSKLRIADGSLYPANSELIFLATSSNPKTPSRDKARLVSNRRENLTHKIESTSLLHSNRQPIVD